MPSRGQLLDIDTLHGKARAVCTSKELEAWEAVHIKRMTTRHAADHLQISASSLRDRIANANRKIAEASRAEFPPTPTRTEPRYPAGEPNYAIILLIERDGPNCYLCGEETTPGNQALEHIIPRIHGGTDDPSNFALACRNCNSIKGAKFVSFLITSARPVYHPAR